MIRIPTDFSEITIADFQKAKSDNDLELIEAFGVCDNVLSEPAAAVKLAAEGIREVLACETSRHLKIIEVNGKRFGFVPDWTAFTQGQYMDICEYLKDPINNAHKIMCILYSPITREFNGTYEVKKYTGTKEADIFKEAPAELFNGAMLFFCNIKRDYLKTSLFYLTGLKSQPKKPSQVSGDGITRFRRWLGATWRKLRD